MKKTVIITLIVSCVIAAMTVWESANRENYSTDCFAAGGDMVTNNFGILSCWKKSGKRIILEREIVNRSNLTRENNVTEDRER